MKSTIYAVVGALALFGCGGGGGGNDGGSSPSTARVAFVNASPDAGALDFRRDGDTKASNVAFAMASGFSTVGSGDADFSVRTAGGGEDVWSQSNAPAADTDNLVVGVGLLTPPSDTTVTPPVSELGKRLVLAFSQIDRTTPTGNRARLIVVNGFVRQAGYETPAIDFLTTDTPASVTVSNIAFGAIQSQDVDSGTTTFQVRQTNTDQVFVVGTPLTLAPGKVYVALVSGVEGATDTSLPAIRLIPISTRD